MNLDPGRPGRFTIIVRVGPMSLLRTVLNIIWLVLAGFWMAIGYVIAGIICCMSKASIPT